MSILKWYKIAKGIMILPDKFFLVDDGIFPNSKLPVLFFKGALQLPPMSTAGTIKKLFSRNDLGNTWRAGIFTYHHYHSITHEVLGIIKGQTNLQLGGEGGVRLNIREGDLLVIPAGVAHKNLHAQEDVICIGGYPGGSKFDILYGHKTERPQADQNIAAVPLPTTDPVYGNFQGVPQIWRSFSQS